MLITLLCSLAAFLKTVAFVPQALKVLKSGDTAGISLSMYILTSVGVTSWIIYGVHHKNAAIVVSNVITLCLCLSILALKLRVEYLQSNKEMAQVS